MQKSGETKRGRLALRRTPSKPPESARSPRSGFFSRLGKSPKQKQKASPKAASPKAASSSKKRKSPSAPSAAPSDPPKSGRKLQNKSKPFWEAKAEQAKPHEVELSKPLQSDVLGLTFELPEDAASHKGLVVSEIHPGGLAAASKKLKVGDLVSQINGRPVVTPEEGAALMRAARGALRLVVARVGAKARGSTGSAPAPAPAAADATAPAAKTATVVVSCSQLIRESKKIVGGSLDGALDELHASLKSKQLSSAAALERLKGLVGQLVVEQAGLVLASAQQGALPEGWVEYFDQPTGRAYYYHVHTKETSWEKPRHDRVVGRAHPAPKPAPEPADKSATQQPPPRRSGRSPVAASAGGGASSASSPRAAIQPWAGPGAARGAGAGAGSASGAGGTRAASSAAKGGSRGWAAAAARGADTSSSSSSSEEEEEDGALSGAARKRLRGASGKPPRHRHVSMHSTNTAPSPRHHLPNIWQAQCATTSRTASRPTSPCDAPRR